MIGINKKIYIILYYITEIEAILDIIHRSNIK